SVVETPEHRQVVQQTATTAFHRGPPLAHPGYPMNPWNTRKTRSTPGKSLVRVTKRSNGGRRGPRADRRPALVPVGHPLERVGRAENRLLRAGPACERETDREPLDEAGGHADHRQTGEAPRRVERDH